jgi:hypothetical protein
MLRIAGLLLLTVLGLAPPTHPPLGAILIGPMFGDWDAVQRPIVRTAGFTVAKVHIPVGFQTTPAHVERLLADGVRTVILRTEDCAIAPEPIRQDLFGRGFWALIERRPDIRWAVEVGNEPDRCPGANADTLRAWYRNAGQGLQDVRRQVELILSMPVALPNAEAIVRDRELLGLYDGLGTHLYGHYRIEDGGSGDWLAIHALALRTGMPVWVTEIGINDPGTPSDEKARRIRDWARQQPERVQAVVLFTIGQGTQWPQYEIDLRMAAEFGGCRYFPETRQPLCPPFRQYWEANGGLRLFGYPVTPPVSEQGRLVQYTERAVFEFHPENPPEWQVLLRRVGSDAAQRNGYHGLGIP